MNMKKGFTLAEVLITLSIIGVVSALTLPNLSSGYSRQVTATQLSKAINTLENANAITLLNTPALSGNRYYTAISNSIKATLRNSANNPPANHYKTFDGGPNGIATNPAANVVFDTKDGMTFIQTSLITTAAGNANLPDMYGGRYYTIYVDINGSAKAPNAVGKDLFQLNIDTLGTVIPNGGTAWAQYNVGANANPAWNTAGTACKKNDIDNALNCAGAIVDNGYSVNYF